ncbi:helix-turn-helix transcriptional regulator [Dehalogenimonas etheniformans]|uniref:XRE family transcriptional regulator n=1 Tax=Dehalogenimonas etheniformans TaxID=1536648 RepID=A0A2P5P508_9CHLR|nr:helix-turn-helix transcriptional regulator [Dehalogenimonas etheniformans]PPD57373.1 XRE family transcriptional regulator [Dehalogenimonas etheniformans]QNT75223.1 helix-turn-helix transcriptional regulator [Dehalogenimonas etheniformans]
MKLREARANALMTAQSLADKGEVSVATINKIEQGAWLPSLKTVKKLADVLGIKPGDVEEFQAAINKAAGKGK